MKKIICLLLTTIFMVGVLSSCGNKHKCTFDQKVISEQYLSSGATCQNPALYYYSCECGKKGTETFSYGDTLPHEFTAQVIDPKYEKKKATCTEEGEYYMSCINCGHQSFKKTFKTEKSNNHVFDREVKDAKYLKEEATFETNAVYYKSCICGLCGEETFLGDKLRVFTDEEKIPYQPMSLTITLYDSINSIYGFTYNTQSEPLRPVIQIRLADSEDEWSEYSATVEEMTTGEGEKQLYYISKTAVKLAADTRYEYRAYDKYVDTGSQEAILETKNPSAESFTFIHVSDTQEYPAYFTDVLEQTEGIADFILHTGDVVEYSAYEATWKEMLHDNFTYLSKIPIMAISGNHETTYVHSGTHETYKHFHYKIPEQASTERGIYYSFVYGNVKFIMLNTNNLDLAHRNGLEEEQYNWFISELENNTCKWTVVSRHNPMYSVGKYGPDANGNEALWLQQQLQGVFARYGVDIVFQGHDHCISATFPIDEHGDPQEENLQVEEGVSYLVNPNGVIYVMDGTGGGQTRSPVTTDASLYKYAQASNRSSWAEYSFDNDKLTITVKYYDGSSVNVYQTWGIKKTV